MVDPRSDAADVALTVRVPAETLERVDMLVKARQTRIPRHSWLLEAIYEKLHKEERVHGDLEVCLESKAGPAAASSYRLRFFRLDRRKGRPVVPMTVVGDDSLEVYLTEWGLSSENAKGWIQKLKADRSVSIRGVMMPAERAGRYGFKAPGWGIQIELGDGRTIVLNPDHPLNLPDEAIGDKLSIFGPNGQQDAMITASGRVLLLLEEHIWPPGAPPGTIMRKFADASANETKEFLDIYRLYVPD
jgi:hypothetical protein